MGTRLYDLIIRDPSLQLFWLLNELSGTTALDKSPNGRNGTYTGGVALGRTGIFPGDSRWHSAYFDGANDYVTSTYNAFGTTKTYEGVYRNVDRSARHCLFGSGSGGQMCAVSTFDDVQFWPATSSGPATWSAAWPGDGIPTHWILTHDEPNHKSRLIVNGVDVGEKTGLPTMSGTGNFIAGSRSFSGDFAKGEMQFVAVYAGIMPVELAIEHGRAFLRRSGLSIARRLRAA